MCTRFLPTLAMIGLAAAVSHAGEIHWRSGTIQTDFRGAEATAEELESLARLRDGLSSRHVVVQFDRPLSEAEKQRLRGAGLRLQNALGDHAYYARLDASAFRRDVVAAVDGLQAVLVVDPFWKLHPAFIAGEVLPWTIVDQPAADADELEALEASDASAADAVADEMRGDPIVGVYVVFHPDVDLSDAAMIVTSYGASIRSSVHSVSTLVVELPYSQVFALANEDGVLYLEPPLPQFAELNNSNRARVGADQAQTPPYNLDGSGVRVMVYDGGGVLASHPDLVGRVRSGDGAALANHSTHVAGTIGGTGAASSGTYRGMAPGVMIDSYEFSTGGPLQAGFLYTDPGDLEADYNDSMNNFGSDIASNSIGSNVAPNGFPCSWEGDYNVTSSLIDAIVRGSLGAPYRIVWAGGNERGSGACGTTYNTVAPPSGAKNHISVGALNSNDDSITSFTSWGPTDDGRLKPDVSAPGCQSNDDLGVTSCSSSGGYTVYCGTSMATPTTSGVGALLLQQFRLDYPGEPDFRNSTLKAILAHTAVDIANAGPDFQSGYGSIRAVPAIDFVSSGNFFEGELVQGETVQVLVIVGPSDTQLKVTLTWDDAPGTPAVSPVLVNDLDLRVFDPGLTRYYPWTLNPASPATPAVRTQEDHTNNIEQVVIDTPAPGAYLVEIHGFNVPQGPQTFSLAASPLLVQCSTKGSVVLDRDEYTCQSTVGVRINDCDLNTDDGTVQTVNITVASTSEPGGETITLTETAPETALFVGSLPLDTVDAGGVLLVAEGDTITATYIDADDGFGGTNVMVTDTAPVDCTAPVVSNAQVVDIDPRSARVTFDTDEDATATVYYGLDCEVLNNQAGAPGFQQAHSISLSGLVDDTTYLYAIEVEDAAGNITYDDNGGACYTFVTPEIPDYFTELFPTFDLHNTALQFAPNGSIDFYGVCSFATTVLPTDPAGGTLLPLNDTASASINLSGGHSVLLYGVSYNSFYVNANGNITFGTSDSDSTETIDDHFDTPRVSAFFDDLDPSEGGQVSWKELSDRVVVSWVDVPEDAVGNDLTFQIELYYDGRIQLAWLDIPATDGLVGLSAGGGTPIDYFSSDLSEFPDCGPRPPSAAGRTVELGRGRSALVTLLASDDGTPPPGVLSYIVTSLPAYELLDPNNGQVITPGDLPYTLANGGNTLIYTPDPNFLGQDSFDFKANDGGSPPDAGDSNVATVILKVNPVLELPFFDDFPTTAFDGGKWATVQGATIDDVGIGEPSPPYSARVNGTPTGMDELITHIIDLSSSGGAVLHYAWERTGGGESPDAGDNLWVEYANATGQWETLSQYAGDGPDMSSYTLVEAPLPPEALHQDFRLRFRTRGTSGSTPFDDWFVDNVYITLPGTPLASGALVNVLQNRSATITLQAEDPDSDPLDYMILALPTNGTLADPNGGVISSGDLPYTVLGGGKSVVYTPGVGYLGPDGFDFQVTDGGLLSNVAQVSIDVQPVLGLPFFEPFASQTLDTNRWAITDGVGVDDVGINEPSPPYSARFNAAPDGGDHLECYSIDLDGLADIRFRYAYQRTGGGESPDAGEDLVVEYLNNSLAWVEIARYAGDGPDMTDFIQEDFLLPADALHEQFRVRFTNSGTSGSVLDDWFVDDVEVFSESAPSAFSQFVGIPQYGWKDILLTGSDPTNDPLTFIITTLPALGTLTDRGNGALLDSGMLPYTLTGGGDTVRYIPDWGVTGNDGLTFSVSDGTFVSSPAAVTIQIGGTQPIASFPLNSDPGWSTEGQWAFGVPQGIDFDPSSGFSGQNVYGYNLSGAYEPDISPPWWLTTTAIDCSNAIDTELQFYRWLGVEDSAFDHARIQVSTNGTTWTTVWNHNGGNVVDQAWTLRTFDISAIADEQPTVYIRWGMGPTDDSAQYAGWNLDDISIMGNLKGGVGDLDVDGDLDGADHALLLAAYLSCEGDAAYDVAADLDGDGCVTIQDYLLWIELYRLFQQDPGAPVPTPALGDFDGDGFCDASDWSAMLVCLEGPDNAVSSACESAFDLDLDSDVDTVDVAIFQELYPY